MKKLRIPKWLPMAVWIIAIIVVWEIFASRVEAVKRTPENIMPHLKQIWDALISSKKVAGGKTALQVVMSSAGITLLRALYGFMAGSVLGFILALVMKLSGVVEKIIFPYLMLIQMIPILGMAPIILSITGDINVSRIVIAAILTFYPVATNTLAGFNAVEREKYELMYTYAANKGTIYRKVLIPNSIPYFFTGLKIAAPMAITASILVDTLQGDGGLGCMLSQSLKHAMSVYVFWLIVLFSAIIGIFSSKIMGWLELLVSPWKRKRRAKA
ncbi:MAG: ABC transporter permease [Butyrivibrio sp.]